MLKDEIDVAKRSVLTDTVQITVGEVANMYTQKELNILPDFQRLFRWTPERKSNFVESILIGIPIPPAFVYENPDGTWELIDGLQRISTVLEFMGVLKDPDTGKFKRSRLLETKYLPSLRNVVWEKSDTAVVQEIYEQPDEDSEAGNPVEEGQAVEIPMAQEPEVSAEVEEKSLDKALQLFFRRHRIDFQILKYPSDPKTKFDLFQRLNRGGAYANEQEVRTCSMVLANSDFTSKLKEFTKKDDFQKIFQITTVQHENQKDFEYAVRTVVHTYEDYTPGRDVQEFLDQAILKIMEQQNPEVVLQTIGWSISVLRQCLGDKALTPPKDAPAGIAPRFSLRALESIVVGLARNKEAVIGTNDVEAFVKQKVADFWKQPEIQAMAAPGLRGTVRLQRSVSFGASWFNPNA